MECWDHFFKRSPPKMLRLIEVPIKCWKNLPSSTSVRARAHPLLRARTCSSSVASPIAKIPKGDLEAMPRVTQKQRNWTPKSAERARALHSLCAPCVHGPAVYQLLLQMQKFQRETWRQCKEWFGNKKNWTPKPVVCVRLPCTDIHLIGILKISPLWFSMS